MSNTNNGIIPDGVSVITSLVRLDDEFNAFYERKITVEKNGNNKIVLDPEVGILIDGVPVAGGGGGDPTLPPRVADLEQKVTVLSDDINSLTDRMTVVEDDIDSLTGTTAGLNDEVATLTGTTTGLVSDVNSLTVTTAGLNDEVATLTGTTTGLVSDVNSLTDRMTVAEGDIDNLKTSQNSTSVTVSGLETRMITAETKLAAVETSTTGLNTRTTLLETTANASAATLTTLVPRVSALESSNTNLTGSIANLETSVNNLDTKIIINNDAIAALNTSDGNNSTRITTLEGLATGTSSSLTMMANDIATISTSVENNTAAITTVNGVVTNIQTDVTNLGDDLTDVEQNVALLSSRVTATETVTAGMGTSLATAEDNLTSLEARVTVNEGDISTLKTTTSVIPSMDTRITNLENSGGGDPVVLPYYVTPSSVDFGTGFTKVDKDKITLGTEQVLPATITEMKSVNTRFNSFNTAQLPDTNSHAVYWDQATSELKWSTEVLTSVTLPSYLKPTQVDMGTGQNITLEGRSTLSANSLNLQSLPNTGSISYGVEGIAYTSNPSDPTKNVTITPVKMFQGEKMVTDSSNTTALAFDGAKKIVVYDKALGASGFDNMNIPAYLKETNITMGSAVLDTPTLTGVIGLNTKYTGFANVPTPGANDVDVIFNTATQKYNYTPRVDISNVLPSYLKPSTIEMATGVSNSTLINSTTYGFTSSPSQYAYDKLTIADSGNTLAFSCNKDGLELSNTGVVTVDNPATITMRRPQLASLQRLVTAAEGSTGADSRVITYDTILKTYTLANLPITYSYLNEFSIEMDSATPGSMVLATDKLYSTSGTEVSGVKNNTFSTSMTKQDNSGFLAFTSTDPENGVRYGQGGISSLASSIPVFNLTSQKLASLATLTDYGSITATGKYFSVMNRTAGGVITSGYDKVPGAFTAVKDVVFDFTGIGTVNALVNGSIAPAINRNAIYFPITAGSSTIDSTYLCQKELVFTGLPAVGGFGYKSKTSNTGMEVSQHDGSTGALISTSKYGHNLIDMGPDAYMAKTEFSNLGAFGRTGLVVRPVPNGSSSYPNTIASNGSYPIFNSTTGFFQMMVPRVARISIPSTVISVYNGANSPISGSFNVYRIKNILNIPGDEAVITFINDFSVTTSGGSSSRTFAFVLPYNVFYGDVTITAQSNLMGMYFAQGGSLNNSEISVITSVSLRTVSPPIVVNGVPCNYGFLVTILFQRTSNASVNKIWYNTTITVNRHGPNHIAITGSGYT